MRNRLFFALTIVAVLVFGAAGQKLPGEKDESLGRGIRGVDKTRVCPLVGPFEVLEQLRKDFWHAGLFSRIYRKNHNSGTTNVSQMIIFIGDAQSAPPAPAAERSKYPGPEHSR